MKLNRLLLIAAGNVILTFGLYNIHAQSDITEGGILGALLLLQHWFGLSPAVTGILLNAACFAAGIRVLGRDFLKYSAAAALMFSAFYAFWSAFPPLLPPLSSRPLLAALLGAVFVGVGAGLSVRAGGASAGDDALAMTLCRLTGVNLSWFYLASDIIVLLLSLSYIPWRRIAWSLLTVCLSGFIIGRLNPLSGSHGGEARS